MNKVNLCLSGSGTVFYILFGAVKRILELREIGELSGTSGGSIIVSMLAMGYSTKDIENIITNEIDLKSMKDFNFGLFLNSGNGILSGNKIYSMLKKYLNVNIKNSLYPIHIITTDNEKEQKKVFTNNDNVMLYDCVRASMSIPIVFNTHEIDGIQYSDGGSVDNLAVDCFNNTNKIIALQISDNTKPSKANNLLDSAIKFVRTSIKNNESDSIETVKNNLTLIKLYSEYNSLSFDFSKQDIKRMIETGYNQAKKVI